MFSGLQLTSGESRTDDVRLDEGKSETLDDVVEIEIYVFMKRRIENLNLNLRPYIQF